MITIRNGEIKDIPAALSLIKELALYENALGEVLTTIDSMGKMGSEIENFLNFL